MMPFLDNDLKSGRLDREKDTANLLTIMCLEAARELKLIDPKINFQVHRGMDIPNIGAVSFSGMKNPLKSSLFCAFLSGCGRSAAPTKRG